MKKFIQKTLLLLLLTYLPTPVFGFCFWSFVVEHKNTNAGRIAAEIYHQYADKISTVEAINEAGISVAKVGDLTIVDAQTFIFKIVPTSTFDKTKAPKLIVRSRLGATLDPNEVKTTVQKIVREYNPPSVTFEVVQIEEKTGWWRNLLLWSKHFSNRVFNKLLNMSPKSIDVPLQTITN